MAESNKQRDNKQEAKEPAPCACAEPAVAVAQAHALPNGDRPQKRPEKRRQSLGGFFKGLVGVTSCISFWALASGELPAS